MTGGGPRPAKVLEIRHGLLVEALADAGFTVLPVNPDLVARRPGPAKKNVDSEDARICCLMALGACLDLRRLVPNGEADTELRAIARDDERAARDERRIGNRLRADLLAVLPAAVEIGDGDVGAPRYGRSKAPKDPGEPFPGGEIYLRMPGLGDRLAARVAGEIGEAVHAASRKRGRPPATAA